MAVFRIEKTQNYTVMSNHHLRNESLSLKAKGLLSQMLSLPESWDFTLKGLTYINREKIDAIREAVRELERAGYITRSRVRDEKGRLQGADYIIHELPQKADAQTPENKGFSPKLDFPMLDNPTLENPMQINKEIRNKEKSKTDLINPVPFRSTREPERKGTEAAENNTVNAYREIIQENIEYEYLTAQNPHDADRISEIADLIFETVCTARKTIRIAGDDYPAELVKSKFLKLNSGHIEFVIDCMRKNTTEIRNIKKYMLAVLFNAPSTIDSYYTALVAHDMAKEE